MITYQSFSDGIKNYYAVYIPPHDDVPHLLVPLKVNFRGIYKTSYSGKISIDVVSNKRTTVYHCLLEDNPYANRNMKPTNMLQLIAYQNSWLPKGKLYVTEDKQLLMKHIRDFYRTESHHGRITARGTYQKVMNMLKQL